MLRSGPRVPAASLAVALTALALLASGCASGARAASHRPSARAHAASPASTTTSAASATTTTSSAHAVTTTPGGTRTTTTAPHSPFPAIVVEAMSQFVPLPAGARAPIRLPAVPGYYTAETGGLGGTANVTLVVTSKPIPVNSPGLSPSQGTELASFSTTPTASAATASSSLSQAKSQQIAACGGPSQPVTLAGGTPATTCPTLNGAAVNWTSGGWPVQVLTLSGSSPSLDEASQINSTLASAGLPQTSAPGFVTVQVPASPSVGPSDTASLEWVVGAAVYQVRSSDNPTAAIAVATAMRPYPGG